jgi:restriction system protein
MRIDEALPGIEQVARLTPWGQVAFAARCARRVQPFFAKEEIEVSQESLECVDKAILVAEQEAANIRVASETFEAASEINSIPKVAKSARAAYAAFAALYSAQAADASADYVAGMSPESLYAKTITKCTLAASCAAALAVASPATASARDMAPILLSRSADDVVRTASIAPRDPAKFQRFGNELTRDLGLLTKAANEEQWIKSTPVSRHFFSLRSDFDLSKTVDTRTILEVASTIDSRLIEYFRGHPEHLYTISPRQFEEVIATLFDGFGFSVELTKRTRDGGRDVIAIRDSPARLKYLVECKRYSESRVVGVSIVRELLGVVTLEGATKGIVATTSHFTRDANAVFDRVPWLLEGRDFDGLVEWLDQYQAFQIAKIRED